MAEETCKHPACGCQVEADREFCSSGCQEALARGATEECGCDHASCQ